MAEWKPLKQDLSIYQKFDWDYPPVAVKYLYYKPEGVKQLDTHVALCEMFKLAGEREEPFYITKENEDCVGKMPLGWTGPMPPYAESGQIGEVNEIFQEPRANARLYKHFYTLPEGTVNYIMYARLDQCAFEPDLLIMAPRPGQAEIILRAMSYSTGEPWFPKATPVLSCSWVYVYPYLSGNVNYVMTGMHFGMKARKVMPEGYLLLSIPYNWIPTITQNLHEMKWVLPAYAYETREAWMEAEEKLYADLAVKAENP
jgi:uncharacterized protein (DUF169 family)